MIMLKKSYFFILISFIVIISIIILSRNKAISQDKKKIMKVIVTGNHLSADKDVQLVRIWDNFRIEEAGITLTADEAIYNLGNGTFTISGNVNFKRPGSSITSDKVLIYQAEQRGIWEGNVKIIQEKFGKNGKDNFLKDGPVTITCNSLEFYWASPGHGTAKGNVQAHQKDNHIFSDMATYTEPDQILVLENNVKLEKEKEATVRCKKMILNIKEESIDAKGIEIDLMNIKDLFKF